ncbi:Gag-Pol polyprotein [Gossypium australe]|uniref:Gag-Pol polyprotein n=1 Tax=Gossypium australe TaxID=47621 RepID=A0A5B6ULS5_9ROSI|nr:Gag-Pol polyprotein [Gossypium australe]
MKCVVSLLRDSAHQWWNTLLSVVPMERVNWEVFQEEFWKKYINQRFIDQKRKEFFELKQGWMTVTDYEHEFVRLSKYARDCISTEAIMCKRSKGKQYSGIKAQTTLVASVGNTRPNIPDVHSVVDVTLVSAEHMRAPVLSVVLKIILLENAPRWLRKRKFRVLDWEVLLKGNNREAREVERVVKVHPESRLQDLRVERLRGLMPFTLAKRHHPLMKLRSNLILLPFDGFDIILGMDWLTAYDVIVNYGKKYIELRCENGDTLRVGSDE